MASGGSIVAGGANDLILNAGESGTPDIYLQSGGSTKVKVEGSNGKVKIASATTATPQLTIGGTAGGGSRGIELLDDNAGKYNFLIAAQEHINNGFEITPSTAVGGTTYTNPALVIEGATGNVIFNENGIDADFRVETDGNENMLFVDGGANKVGIGRDPQDNGSTLQVAADATASTDLQLALRGLSNENKKLLLGFDTTSNIASITSLEAGVTHRPLHLQGSEFVWNESGSDHDFRVESDGNANMLFVDASLNRVGIGASPNSTLTVSNTANSDGGNIADFSGHDAGQRLIVANFSCGSDESRAGLYWENQGVVNMRMWMANNGKLYLKSSNPASNADGDRILTDQANVGGTGDRGFNIPNGDRLGFDQTGTRSWTMKATAGNLTINSGDGNGQTDVNMNLYTAGDLTVNGAHHKKGAYQSTYGATYIGSEYLARGLTGIVLHTYADYYASWNTSTETIGIFEVSQDSANWADKYIMVEVFHTMYDGGGYARYYWNSQYNSNSLIEIEKNGSNSGVTAAVSSLTTVTGNHKKATFNLTFGYYQHATVRVTSNMTASTTITGPNQLRFLQ